MRQFLALVLAAASGAAAAQTPAVNRMPDGSRDLYLGLGAQSAPRYEGAGERRWRTGSDAMALFRHLTLLTALSLTAGFGSAQAPDGEWVSYRDAYRAMVVFEKYGKPKHLIQNHFQVMARAKGVSTAGLRLILQGKSMQLNLPLDPAGRAVFPLLKAAYDENAALLLNRKLSQFVLRPRLSLVVRPDGVYEAAELRAACEQALNYARYADASVARRRATAPVRPRWRAPAAACTPYC